ncbi:MAG: ORF6N domain-containing protein [Candidatus Delongbacteria bacterium]|nr:ORF6N domain-containing protein [Candidatus Delongbacteria bacterium]
MQKNEIVKFDTIILKDKIFSIRNLQVMLDRDLAILYNVKPFRLREQVKRNKRRFPVDFMFRLDKKEISLMVSQNAIPSKKHLGGSAPYVFTEQGVAALSSILTSDIAIEISIKIMRAFVEMRKFINSNSQIFQRLDRIEVKQIETEHKFDKVFSALESKNIIPKQGIFFEGQIFDAYNFVSNLFKSAKESVTIIDNYIDNSVLIHLTEVKKNIKVKILTSSISEKLQQDIEKFENQYFPIEIKIFKQSHDRFVIIDDKDVYHLGASLKDLGKKWFAFSKMDKNALNLLNKIEEI